jgi:hypothetical protein
MNNIILLLLGLLLFVLPFFLIIFLINWVKKRNKRISAAIQYFGQIIGFKFLTDGDISSVSGKVLTGKGLKTFGREPILDCKMYNVLSGSIEGVPLRMFHYLYNSYYDDRRKNGYHILYTVFEITNSKKLPNIILMGHIPVIDFLGKFAFNFGKQLELEGDFYKHFTIFSDKESIMTVYQLFTPDVMQKFKDKLYNKGTTSGFTIEICDNKLYLHIPRIIYQKDLLLDLFELTKFLAGVFKKNIEHI